MKPFDEEAAKRGEKVEMNCSGRWKPVYYVGQSSAGFPVVQLTDGIVPETPEIVWERSFLRMAEKRKVTKWAVVNNRHIFLTKPEAEEHHKALSDYGCFKYSILPIEVEE